MTPAAGIPCKFCHRAGTVEMPHVEVSIAEHPQVHVNCQSSLTLICF